MGDFYSKKIKINNLFLFILFIIVAQPSQIIAQSVTTPQVPFKQRTSAADPSKTIYNIKGDFTMIGNTNLTLATYGNNTNNENNQMRYVDIDGDNTTLNSSMATLELSNSGENSANQNCSNVIYAGLYWTGKSQDADTFSVTKNSVTKNYNKKTISLKGPGITTPYTTITSKNNGTNSDLLFPGTDHSGIFVGYQEITDYVKTHGPGAYTVADIALIEGNNGTASAQRPGYSGGWAMVVIYENPNMKSRAVTLFDGYAYVNGQRSGGGEYGNINISGFTTVDAGPVNMKLGVMAAEGDVASSGDYLAVQKLNLDSTNYPTNYLVFNNTASPSVTNNFFNSSIVTTGTKNPNYQNNTGIDINMFTIPNTGNLIIGNKQTSTNFRFGSTYEVYTIFGFAMSVDSYVPEPSGEISINSINNVTNPTVLNALPGQEISYSLAISNAGTEATTNTIVSIPIPNTAIFNTGGIISYNTYHGFTTTNVPKYDSASNRIIWDLGTLPITAGHPEYIYANLSFKLSVTNDCSILLNAGCNPQVSLETGNIVGTGATSGTTTTKHFFQGYESSVCKKPIDGSIKVAINSSSCLATLAGTDQSPSCGLESVRLSATTNLTGMWTIISGPAGGGELFSNSTSPNSEFFSPNSGVYVLRWTISASGNCPAVSDDVQITLNACQHLDFDGIDDHVNFKDNFNLNNSPFSFEIWIKPETTNTNIQTILSKRNAPDLNNGYDLRLVNNTISFNWNSSNLLSSDYAISTGRWYHIAVTFDGTHYNLYIDGIKVKNATGTYPIVNSSTKFILGAMAQNTTFPYNPINYYKGWMQELRIWKVALTDAQIRQMMNQKIEENSANVYGSTVPLNIPGLSWSNLEGYYPMVQTTDLSNGYLIDNSTNFRNGKLVNIYTQQPETAPLPYTSIKDGAWEDKSTWTHGTVWNVPNTLGIVIDNKTYIDWNIVKTNNNITTSGNKIVLGLLVTNNTLSANNDNKLQISHYLKLDGKIDLVNKSQLIQKLGSVLDVSSSGSIERDQQGQSNLFNYNYWSAPVSRINTISNNQNYTVASVMKDGTSTTPQNINWIEGYNGAPTNPISTARYWLLKFDNYSNLYANWVRFKENDPIRVGQGYTMKGSGAASGTQNYTFVGKPNNGLINSNTISDKQLLLAGNPYPSSLDSEAFINDNINSIDGTIYFWEHYASNNTHILKDYQGGYATLNLMGGIAPSSANVDFISKQGTPSRGIPKRFIPVGQAFFLIGKTGAGGTITYNNNQRSFHKEDDVANSNVLYKVPATTKPTSRSNENDIVIEEKYKKIRLGFNSHDDYHRQILLGFMNDKATDKIDFGYDAYNMDNFPNDMYFVNEGNQLVIQGVGAFDKYASYPIGIKTNAEGKVKFMIDELENFETNQAIYIYDNETEIYHNIKKEMLEINLPKGENNSRFSLSFITKEDKIKEEKEALISQINDIIIKHIQNSDDLIINNYIKNEKVKKIKLYTISGREVNSWNIDNNQDQLAIQVRIKKKATGVYIAKIITTKGDFNKKILIQ